MGFGNCAQAKDRVHKEQQKYGDCHGGYSDLEGNSDVSFPDIEWQQEMKNASERAKELAVLAWINYHNKHLPQLPSIPQTLRHFLPSGH